MRHNGQTATFSQGKTLQRACLSVVFHYLDMFMFFVLKKQTKENGFPLIPPPFFFSLKYKVSEIL